MQIVWCLYLLVSLIEMATVVSASKTLTLQWSTTSTNTSDHRQLRTTDVHCAHRKFNNWLHTAQQLCRSVHAVWPKSLQINHTQSLLSCSYCHESSQVMSYHSYPTLSSLAQDHWTHRIQAALTYTVLTTTQPPYLHKLISTRGPRSTRSSCIVTLARPPSSSSLKTTDRSFCYASPCLWNQLPLSVRKPHSGTSSSISYSPIPSPITSSFSDLPLCTSITPSLFHSQLKTYLFHKSYPPVSLLPHGLPPRTFACTVTSELLGFLIWFDFFPYFSFLGRALVVRWPSRQLLSAR